MQEVTTEVLHDVRQAFQEIIGDSQETPFCCTEAEAQDYLAEAQGNLSTITAAFTATRQFLDKEAKANQRYQEEEICSMLVPRFIAEELKRASDQKPQASQRRSRDSRGGSRSELKAEIERRISHIISEEEFSDLCNTPGSSSPILLQAARNTSAYFQGVTHEYVLGKLHELLKKEIGKAIRRQQ